MGEVSTYLHQLRTSVRQQPLALFEGSFFIVTLCSAMHRSSAYRRGAMSSPAFQELPLVDMDPQTGQQCLHRTQYAALCSKPPAPSSCCWDVSPRSSSSWLRRPDTDPDIVGYRLVGGHVFAVKREDWLRAVRTLESVGASANVDAAELDDWIVALWHGRGRCCALLVAAFVLAGLCAGAARVVAEDVAQ
jgi:hypothetical protein